MTTDYQPRYDEHGVGWCSPWARAAARDKAAMDWLCRQTVYGAIVINCDSTQADMEVVDTKTGLVVSRFVGRTVRDAILAAANEEKTNGGTDG